MAATATVVKKFSLGGTANLYVGTIAFDSSYPTGGEAIDISSGNETLEFVHAQIEGGYAFSWDKANQKLIAWYGDYNNASDGVLIEVPNATDLSALTAIDFVAIGS